jgi:hypothetical protein
MVRRGQKPPADFLSHPPWRMMAIVAAAMANQIAKILVFMVVNIHDPS